jgi:succinate-semialdehyde dehydrogenase/glutarate-semialdehyde dehydrogenase
VGDPLDEDIDIGPMASDGQREVVLDHIGDAEKRGAVIECGGGSEGHSTGYFLMPTVLTGVDHSMKVMTEETFGPVLPIMPFSNDTEAVSLANNSDYGLTASVWTRNRSRASRLAEEIEAGSVTINDHMYSFAEPRAIWGGVKQTGIGRSHGPFGLLYLVNTKYISRDFSRIKRQLWWFPYSPFFRRLLNKALLLFHHNRVLQRLRMLIQLVPHLPRITRESPLGNYLKNIPRILKK